MNLTEQRHKRRQDFIDQNQNIIIGSLDDVPFSLEELLSTTNTSVWVKEIYDSGLTGMIYHIEKDGKEYNLKRKRIDALVQNKDGEYSFLNECMTREILYHSKDPYIQKHVAHSVYTNYQEGIILYEWIHGTHPVNMTYQEYMDLFHTLYSFERLGLFEWDLCKGNILIEQGVIKLFDFGYNYEYNPLQMFNSDGLNAPGFYMSERLEVRALMELWMDIEELYGLPALMEAIKVEKAAALNVYLEKQAWLKLNHASKAVIDWHDNIIIRTKEFLRGPDELLMMYRNDQKEFYMKDIEDDLSGKSCTIQTLRKINKLIELSTTQEEKNQYNSIKQEIKRFQIKR